MRICQMLFQIHILTQMNSQVILSFGSWPTEPLLRNFHTLSPTSSKLLKGANVQLQTLLPISPQEFILSNSLSTINKPQIQDLYREEMERRLKKVQILKSLWMRIKQRKRKSQHQSQFLSGQNLSQRSSSKNSLLKKNQKSSPIIFKVQKKNSAYFDYYSNSKNQQLSRRKHKLCHEDQSTKSRKNIKSRLNSKVSPNKDYFGSQHKKYQRKHTKIDTTIQSNKTQVYLQLLDKMNTAMTRWTQIDQKHRNQLLQLSQLTEREKKRLLKIQLIEKQKLKQQIEELKTGLTSSQQLERYLF